MKTKVVQNIETFLHSRFPAFVWHSDIFLSFAPNRQKLNWILKFNISIFFEFVRKENNLDFDGWLDCAPPDRGRGRCQWSRGRCRPPQRWYTPNLTDTTQWALSSRCLLTQWKLGAHFNNYSQSCQSRRWFIYIQLMKNNNLMALTDSLQSESDLGKMLMPVLSKTRLLAKLLLPPAG